MMWWPVVSHLALIVLIAIACAPAKPIETPTVLVEKLMGQDPTATPDPTPTLLPPIATSVPTAIPDLTPECTSASQSSPMTTSQLTQTSITEPTGRFVPSSTTKPIATRIVTLATEVHPHFRIVDVRAAYGHMIVEVQHFHPDGSHYFYQNYAFQGRELYRFPQYVYLLSPGLDSPVRASELRLSDGRLAPIRIGANRREVYYLPPGETWLRQNLSFLGSDSITSVIQMVQGERTTNGWTTGQQRHIVQPLDASIVDEFGADTLATRFAGLKNTAYWQASNSALKVYDGILPPIDPHVSTDPGTIVSIIYPGNDPESTSMDAQVGYGMGTPEEWSVIRELTAGGWNHTDSDSGRDEASIEAGPELKDKSGFCKWVAIKRTMQLFDTSTLSDFAFIDSATFDFVVIDKVDDFAESLSLVLSTPASDTDVVVEDFDQFGTTKQTTDISISKLSDDGSTYNSMTLNSTGLGNISRTGITKLGVRITADADDSEPIWKELKSSVVRFATADQELSGDKRPRLVITHLTPSAWQHTALSEG